MSTRSIAERTRKRVARRTVRSGRTVFSVRLATRLRVRSNSAARELAALEKKNK